MCIRDRGKSAQELSFIMSAAGLFSILLLPVTGWLLDKTLRPRLISGVLLLLSLIHIS